MAKAAWNAETYLRFAAERTKPVQDLVRRIPLEQPRRIIDLGCGPGNSTSVLADRFPAADIIGLDSSPEMLERARTDCPAERYPHLSWQQGDLASWRAAETPDLIFSNAAFQWVPDHSSLVPALFDQLPVGGVLAFQVPDNFAAPAHLLIDEIARSNPWAEALAISAREPASVETPGRYYDLLSPSARSVEIWHTVYHHVLADHLAIVDWMSGTALRPVLSVLDSAQRTEFLERYHAGLIDAFKPQRDGAVLFSFRRLFLVAVR